jgi:TonB family protein
MRGVYWIIGAFIVSLGAHLGALKLLNRIPKERATKSHLVAVVDKKKKKKKEPEEEKPAKADEPPPPPKPIAPPRSAPKPKAPENTPPPPPTNAPAPNAAARAALAALPSIGISMAGGGPGGVGIAIPTGPVGDVAPTGGHAPAAAAKASSGCTEDAVKPKMIGAIAQDRIIAAAQAAGGIEGRIRLEILVDELGNVTSVRVLAGLGGAVDEAAISAGKRVKVSPSTKCGKAVAGRLVVAITVRNPD